MKQQKKSPFAGNGLSRTAMVFRLATMAGIGKLSPVQLNKIRDINPRQLERVYEHLTAPTGSTPPTSGDALFALRLLMK